MKLRDYLGYPVVTIEGFHPFTNLIRLVLHTNIKKTWLFRNHDDAAQYVHSDTERPEVEHPDVCSYGLEDVQ